MIALVKAGARVVSPFPAMEARMSCFLLVSSGTCSVRLVLIFGRNLEFGSFLKSHFWAGYVCFVLLRECISISVTYGDSCN